MTATFTELGSWRGEGVRLGAVLDALAELRRAEQRTATRACVTNLVALVDSEDEAARASDAIHRLGRRHPGRSIVVRPEPDAAPAGVDADVRLHGTTAGGHPVWSEDVRLDVRGEPARHLDSLVEPLTLPDVPVALWFASGLPEPDDPVLLHADLVVVDGETRDQGAVTALAHLARRKVVVDLCWLRLRPWRQLLAALFEVPAHRPFLAGVRTVEAGGPPMPGLLLAAWAASRLGVPAPAVTLTASGATTVRVTAEHGGTTATFTVAEVEAGGAGRGRVEATAEGAGARRRPDRLSLPDDPEAWALGEALLESGRDRTHAQALQAALSILEGRRSDAGSAPGASGQT